MAWTRKQMPYRDMLCQTALRRRETGEASMVRSTPGVCYMGFQTGVRFLPRFLRSVLVIQNVLLVDFLEWCECCYHFDE